MKPRMLRGNEGNPFISLFFFQTIQSLLIFENNYVHSSPVKLQSGKKQKQRRFSLTCHLHLGLGGYEDASGKWGGYWFRARDVLLPRTSF